MSTDKTIQGGQASVLAPANDEPGAVRAAETLLHTPAFDHAAEPSENASDAAADVARPTDVSAPTADVVVLRPVPARISLDRFADALMAARPAPLALDRFADALLAAKPAPLSLEPLALAIQAAAPVTASAEPKPPVAPFAYPAVDPAPELRTAIVHGGGSGGGGPKPTPPARPVADAPPPKAKDELFDIGKTVIAALAIAGVLRVLLFQPFTIPSASMEPNLYQGDYVVVSKWDYGFSRYSFIGGFPPFQGRIFNHPVQRGDIVVFKLPSNPKVDYIKRVIGVPGDQIQMRNNQLYINGVATKDVKVGQLQSVLGDTLRNADVVQETLPGGKTFKTQDFMPDGPLDNTKVYTVPTGYYFAMGDNRDNSSDSRVSPDEGGVGFIPEENIEGKAQMVLFSWYPGASLFNPISWFSKVRPSRFFKPLK